MIHKILVAVENSSNYALVFDSALSLAKTTGASLMLLHVISERNSNYPILPTYTYYPVVNEQYYQHYQEKIAQYKQLGIDFLQNLTFKAIDIGVEAEYTQLFGNPGRKICELASTLEADLILVGSRRLKGLQEMFLGSVSNYVTHHAPCSVLIVPKYLESKSSEAFSESVSSSH